MVSLSVQDSPPVSGLRPVNLRTDLAPLADLIELAFSESMDTGGRAAVREMRTLSRLGPGLSVLLGMNDLAQGVGLGFVWIEDGRLVGNTSIYPANVPTGPTWIIANVAVHPDYRGRGIARQLVKASLDMIRQRNPQATAILQVEAQNDVAYRLYQRLGFVPERTWTTWRRSSTARMPYPVDHSDVYITRRRPNEWRAEFALTERLRPADQGGIGWLRPLHQRFFHRALFGWLSDMINLRSLERLVIRGDDNDLRAVMWLESAFAASTVHMTLLVDTPYRGLYDDALINLATRRYSLRSTLSIEHPADDSITSDLLRRYLFYPQRTLIHMHWHSN